MCLVCTFHLTRDTPLNMPNFDRLQISLDKLPLENPKHFFPVGRFVADWRGKFGIILNFCESEGEHLSSDIAS